MAKPYVILLPASERESLRNSGVIPAGFFRTFDTAADDRSEENGEIPPAYLWPFDLDYAGSAELVSRLIDDPADIAAFFGLDAASDDAERRHNERLIIKLLGAVCVHVVFLDRKRTGSGYAAFESFAKIAEWSRNFRKALDIRFPNEPEFRNAENVLVIIARGQQVKATASELDEFRKTIGVGPECAFRSCYYMDYNLRVGSTQHVAHAADVWNVMVARLILSFMLSREEHPETENSVKTNWQCPGLKLWRSQECLAGIDESKQKLFIEKALGLALNQLRKLLHSSDQIKIPLLSDDDGNRVELPESDKLKAEDDAPDWRSSRGFGWSDFSGRACAEGTVDHSGERWRRKLETVKSDFNKFLAKGNPAEKIPEVAPVFQMVSKTPNNLFACEAALMRLLAECRKRLLVNGPGGICGAAQRGWGKVVAAECERRAQLDAVAAEATEFDKARAHYVGLMPGVIVFSSVSLMLGWVVHRLVMLLGGGLVTSLSLIAAIMVGSAFAVALLIGLHSLAGNRGKAALIADSKKADALMIARDCRVRDMVADSLEVRRQLNLRARRFKAWTLLNRIKAIVLTEIQNKDAEALTYEDDEVPVFDEDPVDSSQHDFCRETCRKFGSYAPDMSTETMVDLCSRVESWWAIQDRQESGSRKDNFIDLWGRLCSIDQECAGYYPSRVFAREIRDFVSRFSHDVRHMEEELVIKNNIRDLREKLSGWFKDMLCSDSYLFATGAINGKHIKETVQIPPVVYFERNDKLVNIDDMNNEANSHRAQLGCFRAVSSGIISSLPQMAFMYQEFLVDFGSDPVTGNLVFREVPDGR